MIKSFLKLYTVFIMAKKLTKKELKVLMGLAYSEENEKKVLEALEGMEDNKSNVISEIAEKQQKLNKMQFIAKNGKKVPEALKTSIKRLEVQIEEKRRLLNSWIKPTINDLNDKYTSFMEVKYEEILKDYVEEIMEEE